MAVIAALLAFASGASAQIAPTLSQDPTSGIYTIEYIDESGTHRIVRFIGPDQVEPGLIVSIEAGIPLRYSYSGITNGANARLRLFSIDVPCENQTVSSVPRPRMKLWNSGRAKLPGPLVFYCAWLLYNRGEEAGVPPGGQLARTLKLQSAWLPGIRPGRATGATEEVVFPGFSDESPEPIHDLFRSTEHPRVFPIVSPKYPPTAFENPVAGISIVLDELTQTCSLGWIGTERDEDGRKSEAGHGQHGERDELCGELGEKLEQAQKHLARGKKANAAHALQEFLHELSEKKGERVNANAYALLFTEVNYLVTHVLGVVPEKDD